MRLAPAVLLAVLYAVLAAEASIPWSSVSRGALPNTDVTHGGLLGMFSADGATSVLHSIKGDKWEAIPSESNPGKLTVTCAHHKSPIVLAGGSAAAGGHALVAMSVNTTRLYPVSKVPSSVTVIAIKPMLNTDDAFGVLALKGADDGSVFVVASGGEAVTEVKLPKTLFANGNVPVQAAFPTPNDWFIVTGVPTARVEALSAAFPRNAGPGAVAAGAYAGEIFRSSDAGATWTSVHNVEDGAFTDIDCMSTELCLASVVIDNANGQIARLKEGAWSPAFRQGAGVVTAVRFAYESGMALATGGLTTEDGRKLGMLLSSARNGIRWEPDLRDNAAPVFDRIATTPDGKTGVASGRDSPGKVVVFKF